MWENFVLLGYLRHLEYLPGKYTLKYPSIGSDFIKTKEKTKPYASESAFWPQGRTWAPLV